MKACARQQYVCNMTQLGEISTTGTILHYAAVFRIVCTPLAFVLFRPESKSVANKWCLVYGFYYLADIPHFTAHGFICEHSLFHPNTISALHPCLSMESCSSKCVPDMKVFMQ